jgi:acetyl-CoA carboxylase carboxyl transferase subunit alpha
LGLVDEVVPEPLGGAHRGRQTTIRAVGEAIERHLAELSGRDGPALVAARREKFLAMGRPTEG